MPQLKRAKIMKGFDMKLLCMKLKCVLHSRSGVHVNNEYIINEMSTRWTYLLVHGTSDKNEVKFSFLGFMILAIFFPFLSIVQIKCVKRF